MFTVAGVSKHDGKLKVRFANDIIRVKILQKHGHEDIRFIELPNAMEKPEVVSYLKTTDLYLDPIIKIAIDDADEKYNGVATVKATKTAKVVKAANKNAPKKETKKPKKPVTPVKAPAKKATTKTTVKTPANKGTTTLADLKSRAATKAKETVKAE